MKRYWKYLHMKSNFVFLPWAAEELCTLVITEAFPEDSGLFKCMAVNPFGSISCSAILEVYNGKRLFKCLPRCIVCLSELSVYSICLSTISVCRCYLWTVSNRIQLLSLSPSHSLSMSVSLAAYDTMLQYLCRSIYRSQERII